MTTTREAALEAALRLARNRLQACAIDYPTGSREMAERSEWADEATAALSTPATEPQGYVEGLAGQDINDAICDALGDAMDCTRVWDAWHYGTMSDEDFVLVRDDAARVEEIVTTINNALAARPAPQPAADTRVVPRYATDEMMQAGLYHCSEDMQWSDLFTTWHYMFDAAVGDSVTDNATPAPSDKIAEAARVLGPDDGLDTAIAILNNEASRDYTQEQINMLRLMVAALRALAGKGE